MDKEKYKEHFRKVEAVVDNYIANLQVAGFKVIMNNHNIGRIHNIEIYRFVPVKRKWFWFKSPRSLYILEPQTHYSLMLPEEIEKLIGIFDNLLQLTDVDYIQNLEIILPGPTERKGKEDGNDKSE